jgi:pimeloyl-ACP methyl ester carboxylesterase
MHRARLSSRVRRAATSRPRRALGLLAGLAVGGLLAAACGASGTMVAAGPPAGLPSFYSVPSGVREEPPGTLLKYVRVAAPGVDGTAYRVMYVSSNEQGESVPVTGLIFVPRTRPPAGGYRVVDWAHGTNGMTNACAPSLDPSTAVPSINALLAKGWLVTASDYQGEGTPPGLLAYLVGGLAAENTLDIARAAENPPFDASNQVLVWGHSEGGQTAMFAWHLAASYAPSLHLVGTVAGAPPSQFQYIYDFLKTSPYRFYLFMAAAGFNLAYGNTRAPLDAVLDPEAIKLLPVLRDGCFTYLEHTLDHYSLSQLVKADPFHIPTWRTLLEANDPANLPPNHVPLLIIQGGADEQIPVVSTQLLAAKLCSEGQDLERWVYPGLSHTGVIPVSTPDMVHWMADRFAGLPSPDPYKPVGEPGVETTTCP